MDTIKTYTTQEVADILKVAYKTVFRYVKAGQLKAVKIGRHYRITEEALRDFLEHGTEENYMQKLKK